MRFSVAVGSVTLAVVVVAAACGGGGGGGYGGSPNAPSTPPPTSSAGVISIVGDRGAQSFSPNPGSPGTGQTVVWRNNDTVPHRIVLNDTTVDTGNIAPGASSRAIELPAAGANYHCTIHPGMVGSVESSAGQPPPPCTGQYC